VVFKFCGRNPKIIMWWPRHVKINNQPRLNDRVSAQAAAGEVLVSQTVKDLVVGSGIGFDDHGLQELKGVPGQWRLYSVISS